MKILLVSFPVYSRLSAKEREFRINVISNVLNETSADFVMFSEHVLKSQEDLYKIGENVAHKQISALFELNEHQGLDGNKLYLLHKNRIIDLETNQVFSTTNEATEENIGNLIEELEQHRQFEVSGKRFLIIQCGENNILKGSTGSAEFRLRNRSDLKRRFSKVLDNVDIILNPVHTRWGRFANFLSRVRTFSEQKRYCFSCCQLKGNQLYNARINPGENVTHVVMHSKKRVPPIYTNETELYLLQMFEIK